MYVYTELTVVILTPTCILIQVNMTGTTDRQEIEILLKACGFVDSAQRDKIRERIGFSSLVEFSLLKESHIKDLLASLSKATRAENRVVMNMKQTMFLQCACEWIGDCKR